MKRNYFHCFDSYDTNRNTNTPRNNCMYHLLDFILIGGSDVVCYIAAVIGFVCLSVHAML